jgi:hypothetical protein
VRTSDHAWADNPGWRASGSGHILAPVDLFRDADGVSVVVPHCPRRLSDLLGTGRLLSPGETVTVAVSLLRGAAEADLLEVIHGTWWVTAAGCPVLATVGSEPWRTETITTVESLIQGGQRDLDEALRRAGAILASAATLRNERAAVEEALFASAEPEPVLVDTLAPVRVRAVQVAREPGSGGDSIGRGGVLKRLLHAFVEAPLAERVDGLIRRLPAAVRRDPRRVGEAPSRGSDRSAPRPVRTRTRRPMWVAAGVAAIVVGAGALWPTDEPKGAPAESKTTPPAATGPARTAESAIGSPTPPPGAGAAERGTDRATTSLEGAASSLLDAYAACAATGCGPDVVEEPTRELPEGPAGEPSGDRSVTVLDDYGGVAAVRVGQPPGQIVVMVRVNDSWLVRDIYDVADQP